jgi:hypothetical protein
MVGDSRQFHIQINGGIRVLVNFSITRRKFSELAVSYIQSHEENNE